MALRTIATLNEHLAESEHNVALQRERSGEVETALADARRSLERRSAASHRTARLALTIALPLLLIAVIVGAWTVLPAVSDNFARPFIPWAEPVQRSAS